MFRAYIAPRIYFKKSNHNILRLKGIQAVSALGSIFYQNNQSCLSNEHVYCHTES